MRLYSDIYSKKRRVYTLDQIYAVEKDVERCAVLVRQVEEEGHASIGRRAK